MDDLTAANKKPDKQKEIEIIRKVCQMSEMQTVKPTRVNVYLESKEGEIYLFDIKQQNQTKMGLRNLNELF